MGFARGRSRRCVLAAAAVAACAVVVACAAPVSAQRPWRASEIPNPVTDPAACGRRGLEKSWLCDPDGVLSVKEADTIEGLQQLVAKGLVPYNKMMCGDTLVGVQIAVVVVRRLASSDDDAAERAAKTVHDSWGVGDPVCNLGVVVLLALDDRTMFISTGKGVRSVLPDGVVYTIARNMKPLLRQHKVAAALEECVDSIGKAVSGKKVRESSAVGSFFSAIRDHLPILFILGIFGGLFYSNHRAERRKRNEYRRCMEQLNRLDDDRAQARANTYQQKSCPICLEDFDEPEDPTAASRPGSSGVAGESIHGSSSRGSPSVASKRVKETGGASERSAAGTSARPVRVLRCGHKFCQDCIRGWLDNSNNLDCPVCRVPLAGDSAGTSSGQASSSANTGGAAANARGGGDHQRELMFRLGRLHHLYPAYITPAMYARWRDPSYTDTYARDSEFRCLDPTTMRRAASIGAHGASSSFGGGSSRGGGGGGTSW